MLSDNPDLNSIIQILEAENTALSERAEDTLLFGLVAETIYQNENSSHLIDQILERISILKNIPFCAYLEQTDEGLRVIDSYLSFAELHNFEIQVSFPEINSRIPLNEGFLILDKSDFESTGFSVHLRSQAFLSTSALIIACCSKSIPYRYFIFMDDQVDENRFPKQHMLLRQIVQLATERLENIFIFGELNQLNQQLDLRVKERTGELTHAVEMLNREIQERKAVEKAMSANEKKLRLVYNAAMDVSFITVDLTKEIIIRSFSPGAEKMFGFKANEVIDKPLRLYQMPNKSDVFTAIRNDLEKLGWSRMDEIVLCRKSGELFTAMLTVYPLIDENMIQTGVLAVCIDISRLKQTQRELIEAREKAEESETKFRTLFEHASDGIFISDRDGNYLEVNESACQMLGYTRDELLKINFKDVILKENLNRTPVKIDELRSGNVVISERILVRKDGTSLPVEISGKMFPDGRMQGIVRDITERKKFEAELIAAKQKAEESDRLKTAFLQNMSHEIRTPLNAIQGFADLLPEFFDDQQELIRFAHIIKQRGNDLLDIISNILDIARIESGQITFNPEECELGEFSNEMENYFYEYQLRLGHDDVEFSLQTDQQVKSLVVFIDQEKLKQILINLVGNAFKFTSSGKIEVNCRLNKPDELLFSVADTGVGIPKEKHTEIFNRFNKVGHDSARLYDGTGLGLSIVMGLLDLTGGRIWLESEKGKGSTFYFTVPFILKNHSTKEQSEANEIDQQHSSGDLKILIVESDEFNSMYLKEILSEAQFDFMHTQYGKQALDLCILQTVDLVLMDMRPPDMDGYQLISQLRKQNSQIRIIAQTAYVTPEDEVKARVAGCDYFLSKPVRQDVLLYKIKSLLNTQYQMSRH